MNSQKKESKKRKVAWGITGAGDRITDYMRIMAELSREYVETLEIQVFISKAGETVLKFYGLLDKLEQTFPKFHVEQNANSPFLAAWMQMHKYDFLLIAPATSNTVAKIASGISDTMLTNAAIMSLKAFVSVYIVPVDFEEKTIVTKLPNGKDMKLRIRKEDVINVRRLQRMEGMHVLSKPERIREVFREKFDHTTM